MTVFEVVIIGRSKVHLVTAGLQPSCVPHRGHTSRRYASLLALPGGGGVKHVGTDRGRQRTRLSHAG